MFWIKDKQKNKNSNLNDLNQKKLKKNHGASTSLKTKEDEYRAQLRNERLKEIQRERKLKERKKAELRNERNQIKDSKIQEKEIRNKTKSHSKIAIIGGGGASSAFIHGAINRCLAKEYILINDFSDNTSMGNSLDLADAQMTINDPEIIVRQGTLNDLEGANILIITTERPAKYRDTRVELVATNSRLINEIGLAVKYSKFNGITIISSDPVEVSSLIYQETTGFSANKVIGIGTTLDTSRLKKYMSDHFQLTPNKIEAYVIGEHSSSLMVPWSLVKVDGKPYEDYLTSKFISTETTNSFISQITTSNKTISGMKGSAVFGTAQTLIEIADTVLNNKNKEMLVSVKLSGQYNNNSIYISVPAVIGSNGIGKIIELDLIDEEKRSFERIINVIEEYVKQARSIICEDRRIISK